MKIGVIADSHDNIEATKKAIQLLQKKGAHVLLHCGDFCAPFMIDEFAKFKGPVHLVFGNIDDRFRSTKKAAEYENITLHGDFAELEFNGKHVALNHYPRIAEILASSHLFEAVFYGHNHIADKRIVGNTLLCNPGELLGRLGKKRVALYDTDTNDIESFEIK